MRKAEILITAALISMIIVLMTTSCKGQKGNTGTAGPAGASASSLLIFQTGVHPNSTYNGVTDTGVYSGNPDQNNSATQISYVGYDTNGSYNAERHLVKFDISAYISPNSKVTDAYLTIYISYATDGGNTLTVYALTRDFVENQATWRLASTALAWTNPGGDYTQIPASDSVFISDYFKYYTFKINSDVVQKWVDNPLNNHGMVITGYEGNTAKNDVYLYNSNYTAADYRPMLKVFYRPE